MNVTAPRHPQFRFLTIAGLNKLKCWHFKYTYTCIFSLYSHIAFLYMYILNVYLWARLIHETKQHLEVYLDLIYALIYG